MMLWCPDWSVRAARQLPQSPQDTGTPLILVTRSVVVACSAAAREQGVASGQRVREAQLRCPTATVLPHDPQHERRAFDPVLRAIEAAVPGVHLVRPGLAAVRAKGAGRFYGSEHLAAQQLLHTVHDRTGLAARLAVADGLFAAEHIAYTTTDQAPLAIVREGSSRRFLERLPVEVLDDQIDSPRMPNLLRRMGIRHLGDLARLRRAEVHSRFGADGLRSHLLACGEDVTLLHARRAPQDHTLRIDLAEGTTHVDQVVTQCAAPAADLVQRLARQALVCRELVLHVSTASGRHQQRHWRHPQHFETSDVLDRLRWQLQDLDDSGGADAIYRVCFEPVEVVPAADQAEGLWGDRPDAHVAHALTGLQKTLGPQGVLTSTVAGGRLLDERRVLRPWGEPLPSPRERRTAQPWPGSLPGPSPATVFTHPVPVELLTASRRPVDVTVRGELLGEPAWLRPPGDGPGRRVTSWAGPWPVRQRWWRPEAARLDRFQLVDERHQAWLLLSDAGRWRAEARYD